MEAPDPTLAAIRIYLNRVATLGAVLADSNSGSGRSLERLNNDVSEALTALASPKKPAKRALRRHLLRIWIASSELLHERGFNATELRAVAEMESALRSALLEIEQRRLQSA